MEHAVNKLYIVIMSFRQKWEVQCYSFLTLALDGVCGWYHAPDVLPSGKRPTVQEADWAAGLAWKGVEKRQFLIPHRCSNPGNSIYTDCVNPSVNR